MSLMQDSKRCAALSANILKLARPDATAAIVNEIEVMIRNAQRSEEVSKAKTAAGREQGRQLNATALIPLPVNVKKIGQDDIESIR